MAIAYNRGCPKERTAHMCTLREGSNYSTTPWFFQKLCCTFSVLVSHIWGIKMNILQKLFQGKCIPVSEHGGNSSCEYEVAVEKLCKIAETLRQYGVPEELISALDKAENEILASSAAFRSISSWLFMAIWLGSFAVPPMRQYMQQRLIRFRPPIHISVQDGRM